VTLCSNPVRLDPRSPLVLHLSLPKLSHCPIKVSQFFQRLVYVIVADVKHSMPWTQSSQLPKGTLRPVSLALTMMGKPGICTQG
jgi:hypothetical protein